MLRLKRSYHLSQLLDRRCPAESHPFLEQVFHIALERGGDQELDFERPENQSYNPRCARVPTILMTEADVEEPAVLAAGMLAASNYGDGIPPHHSASIWSEVNALIEKLRSAEPGVLVKKKMVAEEALLALSLLLDRARHFHLASEETRASCATQLLKDVEEWTLYANKHHQRFALLLQNWSKRYQANQSTQRKR